MSFESLPLGWELAALSDLVTIIRGVTYKKANSINLPEPGFLPVLRANSIQNGKLHFDDLVYVPSDLISEHQKIRAGDIIVAMSSGSRNLVGKSARVNEDWNGGFGAFCGILRPSPLMSNRYASWFTYSAEYRAKVSELSAGMNINNLKPAHFDEIEIPVAPLAEQKQIAAKLDELLAQVDTLKTRLDAIPAILKRFRQSVLAAAVSGRLTEEWRGIEELDGWVDGKLGDFVHKPSYGTSSKSQKEGDVPVLRMGNLQSGRLDWTDLVYTSDQSDIQKYKLHDGDVLFNRTNSPELVGKTSIYRGEREAIYAGYLIRVQCKGDLNPEFLNYHLNSLGAKQYCYSVKSDGVSQSNINAQKLIAYPLSKPPVEEQTEIVSRIEQLFTFADQIEQRVKNAQTRVNNLTQSILAKAFRGELTAEWREQNPDLISGENSAEALLNRIKAQRQSAPLKTRTRKKRA